MQPAGQRFWSVGLNHIDPAALRYKDSGGVWESKYENSMPKWLRTVKNDLTEWHFNTVGWNQEVVTINDQNHRHSRSSTYEEYQWIDMPYCYLLSFIEAHQWEMETRLPMSCPNCHRRLIHRPKHPKTWVKKPVSCQKTMDRPSSGHLCYARWLTTVVGQKPTGKYRINEYVGERASLIAQAWPANE